MIPSFINLLEITPRGALCKVFRWLHNVKLHTYLLKIFPPYTLRGKTWACERAPRHGAQEVPQRREHGPGVSDGERGRIFMETEWATLSTGSAKVHDLVPFGSAFGVTTPTMTPSGPQQDAPASAAAGAAMYGVLGLI